jgi:hypothetical protein
VRYWRVRKVEEITRKISYAATSWGNAGASRSKKMYFLYNFRFGRNVQPKNVGPEDLVLVVETNLDCVEVFSKITRWLAYGLLQTDFKRDTGLEWADLRYFLN